MAFVAGQLHVRGHLGRGFLSVVREAVDGGGIVRVCWSQARGSVVEVAAGQDLGKEVADPLGPPQP